MAGRGTVEKKGPDGKVAVGQERELQLCAKPGQGVTSHALSLEQHIPSVPLFIQKHKQAQRCEVPCPR